MGLKVIIFPILWIEKRPNGEMERPTNPKDRDRWWSAYRSWLIELATIAQKHQIDYLSIGSELSSLEEEIKQLA